MNAFLNNGSSDICVQYKRSVHPVLLNLIENQFILANRMEKSVHLSKLNRSIHMNKWSQNIFSIIGMLYLKYL